MRASSSQMQNILRSKLLQKRNRKFCFTRPIRSDVVIYDRMGSEFVGEAIEDAVSYHVIEVRERINLHFSILARFVFLLLSRVFRSGDYWRLASTRVMHDYAVIAAAKPKVVLTYIDNSHRFGILSRIYRKAEFFAIQNGFRGPRARDFPRIIYTKNLFCHGQETVDKYREAGHQVDRYLVIGSLKDGLYRANRPTRIEKQHDLCWISEYRKERFDTSMPALAKNTQIMLSYIQQYCRDHNKKFCVAGSSKNAVIDGIKESVLEEQFVNDHVELDDITLVPNDGRFSTYAAIDDSEISITTQSTLGLEALGRGCKVLFCNYTGDPYYDIPGIGKHGIWALGSGEEDYASFEKRITEIMSLSADEWWSQTKQCASYFVLAEEQHLPQHRIVDEITKDLSLLPQ